MGKLREDRMEERMRKRGDVFQDSGLFDDVDEDPILEEVASTEVTTGDLAEGETLGENTIDGDTVAEETVGEEVVTNDIAESEESMMTLPTDSGSSSFIQKPEIPPDKYFKLGEEGTYKHYVNQYTAV